MVITSPDVWSAGRLSILHVVRQYLPSLGGLETSVRNLCAQQRAHGLQPSLLTLDRMSHKPETLLARCETIDGSMVYRIPFVGNRRFFLPLLNPKLLTGFDIIHVHGIDPLCDAVCLMKSSFSRPVVLTTHGGFFHTRDYALQKKIYFNTISRLTLGCVDAVIADSTNDQAMMQSIGIPATVIPNAIVPLPRRDASGRDMLYLGRLAVNKRVDLLLLFVACLRERGCAPRLHIVGEDYDHILDELRQKVNQLGLAEVAMIHGYVAPEELAQIVRECKFFVSASRYEGFGMSLVEAMSAELLPFVHANAAFRELLEDANVGFLVDFDRPEQCADQFIEWHLGLDDAVHDRAREFGMRFSWEKLSSGVLEVYRQVLGTQAPDRSRQAIDKKHSVEEKGAPSA
jgi:alpha-1,3-mannosyltransferase